MNTDKLLKDIKDLIKKISMDNGNVEILQLIVNFSVLDNEMMRENIPKAWRIRIDRERAVKEVAEMIERQLPQGIDNVARHIVTCIDMFGK